MGGESEIDHTGMITHGSCLCNILPSRDRPTKHRTASARMTMIHRVKMKAQVSVKWNRRLQQSHFFLLNIVEFFIPITTMPSARSIMKTVSDSGPAFRANTQSTRAPRPRYGLSARCLRTPLSTPFSQTARCFRTGFPGFSSTVDPKVYSKQHRDLD